MKFIILLSALFAVSYATVSGDYGSVGIQGEQTVRGALNTISSYQKAVNTGNSQSFVSRTDYTNNPGIIAHPFAAVAAPLAAPSNYYHIFFFLNFLNYFLLILNFNSVGAAYHAPLAAAYHAPIAAPSN